MCGIVGYLGSDQMLSREESCGAAYLQALTYLLDRSNDGCGFAHFWYRGRPCSSFVAKTLEKLRAEGALSYAPVDAHRRVKLVC